MPVTHATPIRPPSTALFPVLIELICTVAASKWTTLDTMLTCVVFSVFCRDATTHLPPPSRRLNTDENSNILIYAAGHAAEGFFKVQDSEFMSSMDVADTLMMMWEQRRYGKVVFLVDTCRALGMCLDIKAPNVICLTSSDATLESFSHHADPLLGLTFISRWSFESLQLLEHAKCRVKPNEKTALQTSWYDFNYGEERRSLPPPLSVPSHFDAVNSPGAIHQWKLEEFFCDRTREIVSVDVRYDLL
ncbi:GPI-anchor transamidase subunit 8 [Trypanosoma rangeli]|uniref:GPI-anchor transamidase subunit 8 n=1 Tax=Trypanosoma rangeli TaxID=5698 RepID=A0A422NWH9_TRYRA|nr:GPI-anchor transamidase subunit 8 [Trypanosoma rangeli]RNF09872.1 GPI-anchor transamidase subunit 8 [Trypanosoma rangeli]|eukprot:RNF09872.1 GPI-anchor transamidase subunit 8 [Trypanosoma rangeli]